MLWDDFGKLSVKYIIEFDIVVKTPVSIRSGRSYIGLVDNPVVRISRGGESVPYIPGSSIKGVLRHEAERYARSIGEYVCDILHPKKENGELFRKDRAEKEGKEYIPCIICRIFGGPTVASHVYVYDAYPVEGSYSLGVVRRVSISRVTGAQMPGRLFDVEFINPDSIFKGRIDVENIDILSNDDKRAEIFNHAFKMLCKGMVPIGGMKSVGMGIVRVKNIHVKRISLKDGNFIEEDKTEEYKNKVGIKDDNV